MIEISVRTNIKELSKKLEAFANKQIPFATAQALTSLAKMVQAGERKAMGSVFDKPTPFTINSVGVKAARKDYLQAEVYVKDIAAAYLKPYEVGGVNKLNSRALLNPVGVPVNQFGNLNRTAMATLKARSDVFVGSVKTKSGETISGVWQRTAETAKVVSRTGKIRRTSKGVNQTGHLKLLIRFQDAHPIKQHLDYERRAETMVRQNFNKEMGKALAKAMATAK